MTLFVALANPQVSAITADKRCTFLTISGKSLGYHDNRKKLFPISDKHVLTNVGKLDFKPDADIKDMETALEDFSRSQNDNALTSSLHQHLVTKYGSSIDSYLKESLPYIEASVLRQTQGTNVRNLNIYTTNKGAFLSADYTHPNGNTGKFNGFPFPQKQFFLFGYESPRISGFEIPGSILPVKDFIDNDESRFIAQGEGLFLVYKLLAQIDLPQSNAHHTETCLRYLHQVDYFKSNDKQFNFLTTKISKKELRDFNPSDSAKLTRELVQATAECLHHFPVTQDGESRVSKNVDTVKITENGIEFM